MRLLLLTHRREDASFRVRWERFLPELGDVTLLEIAKDRRKAFALARDADTVVLHRRLLGARDFSLLRRNARRLVYDFDDAVYCRPDPPHRSRKREIRFFRTVGRSDIVLAGNRHLAAVARLSAKRVFVIPSTVDAPPPPPPRKLPRFTAVWIGQSVTLPHLELVRDAIVDAGMRLRVIADRAPPGCEFVPWTAATQYERMGECHVGLMPLPATRFARGKCGYKLLQYFAAGLPAIASPVGVNRGFPAILAREPEAWVAALRELADDAGRRAALGAQGLAFVQRRYAAGPLLERLQRVALS